MASLKNLCTAAILLLSIGATAGGLDTPNNVDIVRVSASDGQLSLYIVLDESIDSRASVQKLHKKLNVYAKYASTGQAFKDEPKANPQLPVVLVVMHVNPLSSSEVENLQGVKNSFASKGVKVNIESYEALKNAAPKLPGT